jgi:hypothetical protein
MFWVWLNGLKQKSYKPVPLSLWWSTGASATWILLGHVNPYWDPFLLRWRQALCWDLVYGLPQSK